MKQRNQTVLKNNKSSGNGMKAFFVFLVMSVIVGVVFFVVGDLLQSQNNESQQTEGTTETEKALTPTELLPLDTTYATDNNQVLDSDIPTIENNDEFIKGEAPSKVEYFSSDSATVKLTLGDGKLKGTVKSKNVILLDITDGRIVASLNSEQRVYPASLTKVMTLITAFDFIDDPFSETFTMTQEILEPLIVSGNSLAGFEVGETSPLIDYMYGMIMFSGADAAEGIATYCCGSVDSFVDAMNKKAKEIGLKNSHFTNPIGTHDPQNYSSAHDMALILGYAYEIDLLSEILSTYKYYSTPTDIHPDGLYWESNLQQRMKGDESGTCAVIGGKTGYTTDAGHCVSVFARSNKTNKVYLFCAMGGQGMYDPIFDCIHLLRDYVE